nr:hypothetical protein [uncultured Desulfobulbus sp.]
MSTQQIPPFTPEALALLFARDNFRAFQQPGFPSHYWAPLLAAASGASRNEIFFLAPQDLGQQKGQWLLTLRKMRTQDATMRTIPLHPWLIQLGFVEFVDQQRCGNNQRIFSEYKAGQENAGIPFSRAFVQWIKTTVAVLPVEQQQLFAADFHFPSLRALFWLEAESAGLSFDTLQLLRGGPGDCIEAASEVATIAVQARFPALPAYAELLREMNP